MTDLLSRVFVKNHTEVKRSSVRTAYGVMVSIVGIILNLLLFAGKFTVGTLFGVLSIRADAFNNLSDAGSQIVSLVCFKISSKPADKEHPFGHARMEYIASLIVSMLIFFIANQLFTESIAKFFVTDEKGELSVISMIVLGVSILVKLWLSFFNRKIAKRIDSSVMRATAADSLSDAGATAVVLIASIIEPLVNLPFCLDAVMSLAVSVLICLAALGILNEAKNAILGEAPADEMIECINEIVSHYPDALGIHDMIVHHYGPGRTYASLHIEVDGKRNVYDSHDMIDNIEVDLRNHGIEATVHMDPIETDNEKVTKMREKILAVVQSVDASLRIHDFRFVEGGTHSNMIFDLVVPFDLFPNEKELKKLISAEISHVYPNYYAVMKIDRA